MKNAQHELVSEMFGTGIGNWATLASTEYDDEGLIRKISLVNYEEGGTSATITRDEFIKAATDWSNDRLGEGYVFFEDFANNWLNENWDLIEFDNDICDQLHQQALFGAAIYS